jgi:hypothetical protein
VLALACIAATLAAVLMCSVGWMINGWVFFITVCFLAVYLLCRYADPNRDRAGPAETEVDAGNPPAPLS